MLNRDATGPLGRGRRRGRSGITLTEILISIMIMGIGVISLATLFPLGLLRIRNAQRLARSGYLVESAAADISSRNLLAKPSFTNPFISPWYHTNGVRYDPWLQDSPAFGANWHDPATQTSVGAYAGMGGNRTPTDSTNDYNYYNTYKPGPGIPVAYDPLWRAVTGTYIDYTVPASEARFGSGIGVLPNDPNPGGSSALPSAHGLQRVTNLYGVNVPVPTTTAQVTAKNYFYLTLQTFISPEDVILQDPKGAPNDWAGSRVYNPSAVVPDLTTGTPENDWRFSWLFTGRQTDSSNGSTFDGDLVICENRQFAVDSQTIPGGATITQPAGERVVEAIWGYSTTSASATVGFANGTTRTVLLKWPSALPDPDVRVGGWIADVTYERNAAEAASRSSLPGIGQSTYPMQRCYWYQVAKKNAAVDVASGSGFYRQMTLIVSSPLRAKTPINFSTGQAYHTEAALIMPSVVNVFPRTIYTH